MQPSDFRFHHPLHARAAGVDRPGTALFSHELMDFDSAFAHYWRALAVPYAAAMQRLGGHIVLRKATVECRTAPRVGEPLDVALRCERIDHAGMRFVGAIFHDGQWLSAGEWVCDFADAVTHASRPVPAPLRQLLQAYEAGQPITRVQTGDWATLADAASAVRTAVFVEEQGISRDDEWDAADPTAVHVVVHNLLDMPVATGRLLHEGRPGSGTARIGRVAVDKSLRGTHLGQQVMQALQQAALERGDRHVVLSAQRSAEGFYARLGYVAQGEPYEEVGIAHIDMRRAWGVVGG
ncbi:MAG: GNAT family N-acetyltransferase [Pseudomonadota bacterium]|nr:GNAT family N-acetyltransferase [Pseudomonadota bacterium]